MWIFRYQHWISAENNAPGWKNVKCAIYHSLPCHSTLVYYRIHDRAHTYFVHHELFGRLYHTDERFRVMWDNVPKVSANGLGPHYLQEQGLLGHLSREVKIAIDSKITPLYKLTHKLDFGKLDSDQTLHYLYSTIE
jgi:hypothetical protein